jgi:hypothetical protein
MPAASVENPDALAGFGLVDDDFENEIRLDDDDHAAEGNSTRPEATASGKPEGANQGATARSEPAARSLSQMPTINSRAVRGIVPGSVCEP